MKFKAKKVIGGLLATVMTISSVSVAAVTAVAPVTVLAASTSNVSITESQGWFESAYVEWSPVSGAAQYKAYYKKSGASSYTQLDDQLIRSYGSYWRADAVGLAAGTYSMKVEAYNSSGSLIASAENTNLSVKSYDRSGAAFSSKSTYGSASGAYNDDGTLKSTAQVIYITADTAKTVTADVITSSKGTTTTYTGFQNIITGLQKGYDKRGFDFRIIGTIDADDMDAFGSSSEGLQVKGKSAYSELNLTIEGIGEDAAIKNFGILIRNSGNVEIRNFGIMLCMDDALSLDTNNCNVWVHNMDCFYGATGSDADQAKGDGTMDVKADSTFVTFSYNHFWDNGKSSLCGMKSESASSHITYHHNWFDHSDSRHPRIRTMSVHIYNNYFDSVSKYGVGMTMGGSAFVENNYFKDVTKPMLTSKQGTDASGAGTFSGEDGGIIKAYNNKFAFDKVSSSKLAYVTAKSNSTSFDAVEVSSRSEKVSSSYKAVAGGTSYNNFDTDTSNFDLGVSTSKIDAVDNVPSIVTANAGRMNGGDFPANRSSYSVINDATSYGVDTAFKNAMANYTSSIVSIGGTVSGSSVNTTTQTTTKTTTTEATTETTTKATTTTQTTTKATTTQTTTKATTTTTETTTETTTAAASDAVAMGTYYLNSSTLSSKNTTYANMVFNVRSVESAGIKLRSDNSITFKVNKSCTLTTDPAGKGLIITGNGTSQTTGTGTVSVALTAGTYTITGAASGSNTTITKLVFSSGSATTTEATTETTTKATTTTTKTTTTKATTTTTKATTTETTTETTTKSSGSVSVDIEDDVIYVNRGESASFNTNVSSSDGKYYFEISGGSWWFEAANGFVNVWSSNENNLLTNKKNTFTINQWCGLESGYTFTLTAHVAEDSSVTDTVKIVVQ